MLTQTARQEPFAQEATALLHRLRLDPALSAEALLANLMQLQAAVPGSAPVWSMFSKALQASIAALEIPWADPQLIQWASWSGRSNWLMAELDLASKRQHEPGPELMTMRQRYQASDDGWPLNPTLDTYRANAEFVHRRAAQRLAIHKISEWVDQNTSGTHVVDLVTLNLLIDTAISDRTPSKNLQQTRQQMAGRPKAEIARAVRLDLITEDPSLQYRALCNLEPCDAASVFADTSVRILTTDTGIPEEIAQKIDTFGSIWGERSDNFCIIPASDIKETLHRKGTVLATLSFKDELRVVAQLIPESSFYPKSYERLSHIGSAHMRSSHEPLAWKYYVLTNPEKSSDALAARVDWLQLSDEVLRDCAIVLHGAEVILGVFNIQNPSYRRHQEVGWQEVVTGLRSAPDGSHPKAIMGLPAMGWVGSVLSRRERARARKRERTRNRHHAG
jgi:hypothetical protein